MRNKLSYFAICSTLALATACGDQTDTPHQQEGPADIPQVVGEGKDDNFLSESAQEYFVRGTATVTLEAEFANATEEERIRRAEELVPYRQVVIGWFLNAYLIDKSSDADNAGYGGMKALTKNDSYESLNIRLVEGDTYAFDFVQEVGGQLDLLVELAREADAVQNDDGTWSLELQIGKVSTEEMQDLELNGEWYRSSPWSSFNPEELSEDQLETIELNIEPQESSTNAWIDYPQLIEDGSVDISIFYGWDYHDEGHRKHSRSAFEHLVRAGFEPPVDTWDDYNDNRAPLTKTINVGGQAVEYNITLWWGEPGSHTDPDTDAGGQLLEDEMRAAFARDEVIGFSGHSGPFYGFALANWRTTAEGDLDDSEIGGLEMPRDKYQIVLAEGCDTYALGEAFWSNPNKSAETALDIITTTSFSDAGTPEAVTDFLDALITTDASGELIPATYSDLLDELDNNSYWFDTMYGVHGIDNNPKANPLADTAQLCGECVSDADCGRGGACVGLDAGGACTYECTANEGCPSGYRCQATASEGYIRSSYCVPDEFVCQ